VPLSKRSIRQLAEMKRRGEKIVMVTAYDAPGARLAEAAGIDLLLVGDSAAMVMLGHDSTLPVTLEEMLLLTQAVTRVARRALVVGDLPFGSYQVSDEGAVASAVRLTKDGGADIVKIEVAGVRVARAEAIVGAGIPVMGHIGLTPQSATLLGGYRAQGRTAEEALALVESAIALEAAGCCAIVLEAIPAPVAARISERLTIPTIGIGAGAGCDGQVLVWHDLLGLGEGAPPRFVRPYADLAGTIAHALAAYADDVRSGRFPDESHEYGMPRDEQTRFEERLAGRRETSQGLCPRYPDKPLAG
jgi:3-methyl-2-oxobutanoate hydroxymethyltransferase